MFGLEDIVYCGRVNEEEEYCSSGWVFPSINTSMDYCDVIDGGKSARESALQDQNISTRYYQYRREPVAMPAMTIATGFRSIPTIRIRHERDIRASLEVQFSVLDDWATALHAHHVNDVVHGNLTPESVGVIHGRGTLSPTLLQVPYHRRALRTRESPDDDVHGARWAATELFRIDNGNPSPTKMSDVYSFACLMLQLLTGEVPYCGTKRSEQVVYLKYLGREPIDAQTPKVQDRYAAFMRCCWSPEPEKRPTMETVVDFIHEEVKRLGEQRGQCHAADQNERVL